MSDLATTHPPVKIGEQPTWDIAKLFPNQGQWSIEEYLALDGNHLVEFIDGRVEVLEMPTLVHQLIVAYIYRLLFAFVDANQLGTVVTAPYKVRVSVGKFREPDIFFMRKENRERMRDEFSIGADLVVEVVSESNRSRDFEIKRQDYADAGIPEYWIVDPSAKQITVLKLSGGRYETHGQFATDQSATSNLLPGFTIPVNETFAQR